MHACRFLTRLVLLFAFATFGGAGRAQAQRAVQQVLDLNRQAMDAYTNLEMDQAQQLLNQARELAQRSRVTGAPLARTYVNLGVVAIGGMGDNGSGLELFIRALDADPNVQLDPLTSTPDIQATFALARQRRGGSMPAADETRDSGARTTETSSGNLTHTAAREQLVQTPLPVYVETPQTPAHVYLYYRGRGMREFRRSEMERVAGGYGMEIPCADVFEPAVEYYVVAFGRDGSPIGFIGSQASPISVPIVASRTVEAPALPGRIPPDQCSDRECPPGMPCGDGTAELGESCSTDADCASNRCVDDVCSASTTTQGAPRFFARVGVGVGMSYVPQGLEADRTPCAPGDRDCEDFAVNRPVQSIEGYPDLAPNNTMPARGSVDLNLARSKGYEPASGSREAGYADTTCRLALDADDYANAACMYVRDPGLVANLQLRAEVGYYVLDWLGFSAFARFQPLAGVGTLSFMLIGARVHFRVYDTGQDMGPSLSVHVGGSGGQIQVQVPNNGNAAPWGQSGMGGAHAGVNFTWRFTRNIGVFVSPDFMFQFPQFLFNTDLTVGAEFGF